MQAMQTLPDLSQLSHADKDELIKVLWNQVQQLTAQVVAMQAQIVDLQGRLARNSRNSSKPPSSDGLNKPKPKSLRKAGQKPSGGQKGHPGSTLRQVSEPDQVVRHAPALQCDRCQGDLGACMVVEVRQVFELPPLRMRVTEHQVLQAQCGCGKTHRGQFPNDVTCSVQYGPAALAAMVYLNQHHMLPIKRTAGLLNEMFALPVSQATVIKAGDQAQRQLSATVQAIAQQLQASAVVHADETGMRVDKKLHWMHVLATQTLTWMARHTKRGGQAFEELGLLRGFKGVLVHDGWKPYRALECEHALCNVHHLRELTYVFEEMKQPWAGQMIELLSRANRLDRVRWAEGGTPDYDSLDSVLQAQGLYDEYMALLELGDQANPRAPATGKRGGTKQNFAANLLHRLREYTEDVWRFMSEPEVPFTNNVAEQAVRMPKVKQKISGCFRTPEGADTFCVIRSYLATMHKQSADLFDCLINTFLGAPTQPRLA
jgi:transposase